MNRNDFFDIAKEALHKWQAKNATVRAAALAFFTILPLPSLLVILTAFFALFYGESQALQRIIDQISSVAGPTIAGLVSDLLTSARDPFTSFFESFLSVSFAVAGGIGAFVVLQDTLNLIWDVVQPKKESFKARIKDRLVPFLIVSATGAIILVWTTVTTLLTSSLSFILEPLIGKATGILLSLLQIFFSFSLSTLLFAFIYAQIPDTHINWSDVWLAAVVSGLVATVLNYIFGVYVRAFPVTTIAGAAGSLMLLLLWVFLIDEFILFGANFSKIYAEKLGSRSTQHESSE